MAAREIVQIRSTDFHSALYVSVGGHDRYLVGTDNLCPDCSTPVIRLDGEATLTMFHDHGCVVGRDRGVRCLSVDEYDRVAQIRRDHLEGSPEAGELGLSP